MANEFKLMLDETNIFADEFDQSLLSAVLDECARHFFPLQCSSHEFLVHADSRAKSANHENRDKCRSASQLR